MSITRHELTLELDKLAETFGDKAYGDNRRLAIWDAVDGLELSQVQRLVTQFISTMRQPPLPQDFSTAASSYKRTTKRYALGEIQPYEICRCKDCGDSGFIRLERRPNAAQWAEADVGSAACHCDRGGLLAAAAGRMQNPTILRQFDSSWHDSYKVLPAYEYEARYDHRPLSGSK